MEKWMYQGGRIVTLLMAVIMLMIFDVTDVRGNVSFPTSQAADGESTEGVAEGQWGDTEKEKWVLYSDGRLHLSGSGKMKEISKADDVPWHGYMREITEVTIDDGITNLTNYAFCDCSNLTRIEIPDSVTHIGAGAFSGCSSLAGIEIPDSVTGIGDNAFHGCSRLTDMQIPNSVKSIGDSAFFDCTGLTGIKISDNVGIIGSYVFEGCSSLESIEIPAGVEYVNATAFARCSSLEKIEVAAGNTKYDSRKNCNAIIETLGNELIRGCKNTVIPVGVADIGAGAFLGCSSLENIEIPDGVKSIGKSAFDGCESLKSIEIPKSVKDIGDFAFDGCGSFTIYCPEGAPVEAYAKEKGIHLDYIYEVTFVSDREIIDTQHIKHGHDAVPPADLVKEGHTLSWNGYKNITEDTTVNAVWTIHTYQVTFKDGDKVLATRTVEHGKAAEAPTVESKEGYTFSWDKDFAKIKEDTTVNAVWTIHTYQVTFRDGDKVLAACTVEHGKAAEAPTVESKEGYTFSWDKDFAKIKADTTVNAVWTINTYQVTFKDGDKVLAAQTVEYGKAATAPELSKTGYKLAWDKDFTNIKENITVNAKWTAKQYTVKFHKNGGLKTSKSSIKVTYGKKYGTLPTASRKKYTFSGWYTAKKGGKKITSSSKVSTAKGHALYAHWTRVKTGKAVIKKITPGKKRMTVNLRKVSGAKGYQVVYSANKKFKSAKKVKVTSTKAVIKKLKSRQTLYVKVRAYKTDSTGSKVYGAFSSVKRVKIK